MDLINRHASIRSYKVILDLALVHSETFFIFLR